MKSRVAVTTTSFGKDDRKPIRLLEENGLHVVMNTSGKRLDSAMTIELCSGCTGIIAGTEKYDRATLERLPGLKAISRCGTGMDSIDLCAAGELGIKIGNTPDAPTTPVAELTVGLLLDLLRKISLMDREIRNHFWKKHTGNLLKGKKIGIIGFGRIGRKVADLLTHFETDIAFFDIVPQQNTLYTALGMNDLLGWADIVSIHCSPSSSGKRIIGKEELERMKKGSWLVNCSRGEVIDETALFDALATGRIAGAALDVFEHEPYEGPLSQLPNVVLTPHIGSYAIEARITMELQSSTNLLRMLTQESTD